MTYVWCMAGLIGGNAAAAGCCDAACFIGGADCGATVHSTGGGNTALPVGYAHGYIYIYNKTCNMYLIL